MRQVLQEYEDGCVVLFRSEDGLSVVSIDLKKLAERMGDHTTLDFALPPGCAWTTKQIVEHMRASEEDKAK